MKRQGKKAAGMGLIIISVLLAIPSVLLTLVIAPVGMILIIATLFLLLLGIKFLNQSRMG